MITIEQVLAERAAAMAAHDGVPVALVHLHGAANQLQVELLMARDRLICMPPPAPPAKAASAAEADAIEEEVAEPPAAAGVTGEEAAAPEPVAEAQAEPPASEAPAGDPEQAQ